MCAQVCATIFFALHLCTVGGVRLAIHSTSSPHNIATKYDLTYLGPVGSLPGVHLFLHSLQPSQLARSLSTIINVSAIASNPNVLSVYEQVQLLRYPRYSPPSDPMWPQQWVLHNAGQLGEEHQELDINVEPAWLQGFTGEGVIVAIVDDGIMYHHEDLKDNFITKYSADVADRDDDVFPSTNSATGHLYHHGTNCAGVLAMARDNNLCGVGVAYHSKVAGIRLLSSIHHSDATEASALGLHNQHIAIYSNSWGPKDNGIVVEGPGTLARAALLQGVKEGRDGKGSIYVWASGNGGTIDSCSTDGYASSIYTIAVGSADQRGRRAFYDESCPSKMVVAVHYNKRLTVKSSKIQTVTTSSASNQCSSSFVGTSVACPLVAGAIALALQANPYLTWRDVQYLLSYTARRDGLGTPDHWTTNGGGLRVSQFYGFGAVDGEALVSRSRHWTPVPPQLSCSVHSRLDQRFLNAGHSQLMLLTVSKPKCSLSYLEHVVLRVTLKLGGASRQYRYSDYLAMSSSGNKAGVRMLLNHGDVRRGDVSISLVSPYKTESQLLPQRPRDFVNNEGFRNWPFMSVRHWGESPEGEWLVNISYTPRPHSYSQGYVIVFSVTLVLYGTVEVPVSVLAIPSQCDQQCRASCGGVGPFMCDVCKSFRNADTLECMDSCPDSNILHGNYCISTSTNHSSTAVTAPTVNTDQELFDRLTTSVEESVSLFSSTLSIRALSIQWSLSLMFLI